MVILETIDLKKTYGKGDTAVNALNGINLKIENGEFTAIVGSSGSGKSTLLHMLGGLDRPSALILPAVTLALPYIAAYTRLLRAAILQTLEQDFVLHARACGRSERAILRHVLRNSLRSSLTALGMSLPRLVAGTFVVECIFAWPGLGRLCITAIFNRDLPVIQAYVLFMAALFLFCGRLMELCAALVDPRLRHGERA